MAKFSGRNPATLLCLLGPLIAGCHGLPVTASADKEPAVLRIHEDGTMMLNDRSVDPRDVVIYPDGFGGEKAALKMRVPLHPDYYRDTIIVERAPVVPDTRPD